MTNFRDLDVWKESMELANSCFELTDRKITLFPQEKFGLFAQLRKSAVSVASNIAEGAGRRTNKDFIHFLDMAKGSLNELETQVLLLNMRYPTPEDELCSGILTKITQLQKMLSRFIAVKETHQ